MTREEAARILEVLYGDWDPLEEEDWQAMRKAIEVLHGPVPDPITGLVACGCGGKADCNDLGIVTKEGEKLWWVECTGCGTSTHGHYQEDEARAAWNRAMGGQP